MMPPSAAGAACPSSMRFGEAAAAAADLISAIDDELLAARAADVRDVGARICRILSGTIIEMPEVPSIIIGDDLPPSFGAEIPPGLALGFGMAGGSRTAHVVILARSLGLPAVVGAAGLCETAREVLDRAGEAAVCALDGETGEVFMEVDQAFEATLRERTRALATRRERAAELRSQPGTTSDGRRILLVANIGTADDAQRALDRGAEGVGLFRTEFLFLSRASAPTEIEQVAAYRRVMATFGPDRPVVIRLADIGGDKPIPYLKLRAEDNPFLGVRAIRLAYGSSRDLLETQLRAIWRAGALAGVVPHVMAPMIATLEDVDLLISLRDAARDEVVASGQACARSMATGIMVEVPSAVLLAPELARRVDFMSIGTNDLTQYIFAADRGSAALAQMQDPLHPEVLRAIALIAAAARGAGIPVAVCGEAAGDPAAACVLVGLGIGELSADAASLDELRATLARLELQARGARESGPRALRAASVRALATELLIPWACGIGPSDRRRRKADGAWGYSPTDERICGPVTMSTVSGARTGVAVVVVAAGGGERMTSPVNKVFLLVGGKSILARTLELFDQMPIVDTIVLVVRPIDRVLCEALVRDGPYSKIRRIVSGGASRHASESRGLLALEDEVSSGLVDTILVHDAVRPFVAPDQVEALVAEARATGAAILAIPAGEGLVTVADDGTVHSAGEDLWVAQTPQAFEASVVLDAHRRAAETGFVGTDTSSVVERIGHPVSIVMGRPENIKITTSDDLLRAEFILEQMSDGPRSARLGPLTPRV